MCANGVSRLEHLYICSRYSPGKLQTRKWENALTIDKTSWGLNRNGTISDYMTVKELVDTLVEVVAFNGNVLLNVGPGPDGTLSPIFVDRLLGIGTCYCATVLFMRCRPANFSLFYVTVLPFAIGFRRLVEGQW